MMNYIIIGLLFGIVGCVWYFISHRKPTKSSATHVIERKAQPVTLPSDNHKAEEPAGFIDNLVEVPARIYDNLTRTVKNGMLPASDVRQIRQDYGNLGRRWFRDNEWRYSIVRLTNGKCIPTQQFMTLSLKNPPERLHRALQQEETESFYKPRDNRSLLAKYGAYLLFAGVVIVILFLWGANMMKG